MSGEFGLAAGSGEEHVEDWLEQK